MKSSKKTKTKIIVAVLAVCLAVFGAYKFVDTYSHSYVENKAINYLKFSITDKPGLDLEITV